MKKSAFLAAAAAILMSAPALAQDGPPPGGPGGPGGPRGPMPDQYGDATVAKADAAKTAGEQFAKFDTNHDGKLSGDEQDAAMESPGGRGLRRADGNADGRITREEYLTSQAGRFDQMDGDKDGQLTKAERDAFRAQMRGRMGGGGPGGWGRGRGEGGGAGAETPGQ